MDSILYDRRKVIEYAMVNLNQYSFSDKEYRSILLYVVRQFNKMGKIHSYDIAETIRMDAQMDLH